MPIQPKDKLLQVRIDRGLYDRFAALADSKDLTVSGAVRGFMRYHVDQADARARKDAEWAATLAARAAAASTASAPVVVPPTPLKTRPNDKKLRRLERKQGR